MSNRRSITHGILRMVVLFGHILLGLLQVFIYRFWYGAHWFNSDQNRLRIQEWMKTSCRILGVQVEVKGVISPVQDTLFVANHISWLDIIALASAAPVKFVAKDAVKNWPVIGCLVRMTGNLFIQRGSFFSLNGVISKVRQELENMNGMMVFPEGTTTDGHKVGRFYSALFNAVSKSHHVVQPIALSYRRNGQADTCAPYIGDDNFMFHLFRIACLGHTRVCVNFGEVIIPENMNRHDIASASHTVITQLLHNAGKKYPGTDAQCLVA